MDEQLCARDNNTFTNYGNGKKVITVITSKGCDDNKYEHGEKTENLCY